MLNFELKTKAWFCLTKVEVGAYISGCWQRYLIPLYLYTDFCRTLSGVEG